MAAVNTLQAADLLDAEKMDDVGGRRPEAIVHEEEGGDRGAAEGDVEGLVRRTLRLYLLQQGREGSPLGDGRTWCR